MQDGAVMFKVLEPMRDGPIVQIGQGDLAQPFVHSLWTRFTGLLSAVVDVMREARELEERLIGERGFRGIRES
jgi:hypothetical protein